MRVEDIEGIRIKIASPEDILKWSHGEVTKPDTINYRTQRAEKDGLFDERIFGPEKDYECYCGKYRRIRYKGIVCDRCGVEVTKAQVRRERMGHIKLACPVSHIWFLRGVPSRMGTVLDVSMQHLEKVIYFAAYIITNVNNEAKRDILDKIEKEYKQKIKTFKAEDKDDAASSKKLSAKKAEEAKGKVPSPTKGEKAVKGEEEAGEKKDMKLEAKLSELKKIRDRARDEVLSIKNLQVLSEVEYYDLSLKYGEIFEAGTGAESLRKIFEKIDIKSEIDKARKSLEEATPITKKKILRRLRILQGMHKAQVRPEWMFLTLLPILPPDLRPMVQLDGGRYASSDLNDLYRRVINRNNRLKYLLEINAPEVIVRNEKRMLQEAVDALIDNGMRKGILTTATTGGRRLLKSLADILKGKQGRFRQNLLGKRVDYSGRSVIVVGPELKLHQCGLPKKMALELFKPFVIKKILERELTYNVRGASRLVEQETDEVWAILEEVVRDKLVMLNRAPTLHRLGIQAFQPVLTEGESIRIHPMVCKAFNADFDGDQMAVHVPLGEEAQKEAKDLMLSTHNLLKPATGIPVIAPSQDIILGCYWLTKIRPGAKGEGKDYSSAEEAILANEYGDLDMKAKIKVRTSKGILETCLGRILFNETLPKDYPFANDTMNSKKVEKIVGDIIDKYDQQTIEDTVDKIKSLGFSGATMSGVTWGMDDLTVPKEKEKILEIAEQEIEIIETHFKRGLLSREEKGGKVIEVWTKTKAEIEKLIPKTLPEFGSVFTIVDSGARGSWSQPVQMAGMKGLVINPAGQIIELPVRSSYKEGFDVLEYFISIHGARKGTADTALRTSTAGYLTRRLVDVAHDVIVFEDDCGDKEGFEMLRKEADEIGQNFVFKIVGRMTLEDVVAKSLPAGKAGLPASRGLFPADGQGKKRIIIKKGEIINWEIAKEISDAGIEKVLVRNPISCRAIRGVCQKCYGWDLGSNSLVKQGTAVGIVAAQAIGEPGTQLTMRTFHTGGVASGGDITFGLPRVQEVFEARVPGGKAEISQFDGKVLEITPDRIVKIKILSDAGDKPKKSKKLKISEDGIIEYALPPKSAVLVSKGQDIKRGQQLCEGSLDLKELFKIKGKEEAERYVLQEIQKIYTSQGATIHDKHVEVIVRQMFSRVRVKESGDSPFIAGEVLERSVFLEENIRLKKEKKSPAKAVALLLGISRVSLTTNSFLSAASFQETSRVLIKAALEGKEDRLVGLKENVIIGKLIPAGTGFIKK